MKIENRQQTLIVLVAVAAALLVGNSLVYEPLSKWWSSRSQTIKRLRDQVKHGKALVGNEQNIRGDWDQMRTNTLPNDSSLAEQQALRAFDSWAHQTGVTLNGWMPQWKNDTDDYTTYNIRVEASGTLASLGQFLYDIERDPMALKLDAVELSAHDTGGQVLVLGLQISGLVLNPQVKR
jgi:hypothetical protein